MQPIPFANARRSQRKAATIAITLVVPSEDSKVDHEAYTIDVSLQGARVRTALKLIPGEQVGVVPKGDFPHVTPTAVVWIPTCVVWVRGGPGLWSVAGLEFLQTLPT